MKMYHFTYRTTNLINGKYYLGMHSTTKPFSDGYLGSGVLLQKAINKYGSENFEREELQDYDTREELAKAEKELISDEDVESEKCYNLTFGGLGDLKSDSHKRKIGLANKGKRKGKTKLTDKGFMASSLKMTGRTKENNEGVRRGAETQIGRSKENYEPLMKSSIKQKGRTANSHKGILSMVLKKTGRTKEDHIGVMTQSLNRSRGVIKTPIGSFHNAPVAGINLWMTEVSIKRYSYENEKELTNNRFLRSSGWLKLFGKKHIGKTFKEIGFGTRPYKEGEKEFLIHRARELFDKGEEINYPDIFIEFSNLKDAA